MDRRRFLRGMGAAGALVLNDVGAGVLRAGTHGSTVLLEAENFHEKGGWVVDQQFMDQMGSPILLAHGLGKPVRDATHVVNLPQSGRYRVWVRTRNWVAPWNAKPAPGRFRVLVNRRPLDPVFGTQGRQWHWQDGGMVEVGSGPATVALRDLTGFDGRCDAIVLSTDSGFRPPSEGRRLEQFRREAGGIREPSGTESYDLVIVGGGVAGTAAAITSARLGARTALVQDRPVLGGNNSSEVRVNAGGGILLDPYPELGKVVRAITCTAHDKGCHACHNADPGERYIDEQLLRVAGREKNLDLHLNMRATEVTMDENRITSITARHTHSGIEKKFSAPLFADCTGDANLGYMAGADFRVGREGRKQTGESMAPKKADDMTMGCSTLWNSREADTPVEFPKCPWALRFDEDTAREQTKGSWRWEAGYHRDMITELEHIRDYLWRAVYGNWAYLKQNRETFSHRELNWLAYVAGKRESRRLLGDVILDQLDIDAAKQYPDACVTATWGIDLHHPNPRNAENFPEPFWADNIHPHHAPYPIPYRCLYSRNVENLFMAGRDISVTHVALGTVRLQRTTGMMGEVVGMAGSLCSREGLTPRELYRGNLAELTELMREGAGSGG
ncbi:MAG: FAD-dependent oxidoreductase [Planctomycetota bacterium]